MQVEVAREEEAYTINITTSHKGLLLLVDQPGDKVTRWCLTSTWPGVWSQVSGYHTLSSTCLTHSSRRVKEGAFVIFTPTSADAEVRS